MSFFFPKNLKNLLSREELKPQVKPNTAVSISFVNCTQYYATVLFSGVKFKIHPTSGVKLRVRRPAAAFLKYF